MKKKILTWGIFAVLIMVSMPFVSALHISSASFQSSNPTQDADREYNTFGKLSIENGEGEAGNLFINLQVREMTAGTVTVTTLKGGKETFTASEDQPITLIAIFLGKKSWKMKDSPVMGTKEDPFSANGLFIICDIWFGEWPPEAL
jgi:hypothetical protein